ncbi:MAG: DUF4399 domain-containing protein [Deltaproteobacteria bacterium]|nr:DUF4399 domain-containing protein [Deltaproteobacteria bacterium]
MKRLFFFWALPLFFVALSSNSQGEEQKKAPQGAEVYFIAPQNGETVTNPVTVRFGLKGMGVAPAGILKENTGHHHLLIDLEKMPDLKTPLPKDDHHRHFGGGETETVVNLTPGKHTLQLLLGDLNHIPHNPPVISKKITITVKE